MEQETIGYDDTVLYIIEQGEAFGYEVEVQDFVFSLYDMIEEPTIHMVDDGEPGESIESTAFWYAPQGEGEAIVTAIDVQIPPGEDANSSTSGCEESDFVDFTPGDIALIQRGSCTFTTKAQLAEQAGAVAVFIFNEGQSGRRDVVEGYVEAGMLNIPVFGLSYDDGRVMALSETIVLAQYSLQSESTDVESQNVFFQPRSMEDNYVLLGGHADSVYAGGGINDNGSGISAILSIAESNASLDLPIRYAFWGGEELGLLGSYHYVSSAEFEDLEKITAYINLDMIASPNYARMIYDGDGSMGNSRGSGPGISSEIEEYFEEHFDELEMKHQPTPFDGRSDYGPFIEIGVASGGLFTGAESIKTANEESIYGGNAGEAYDECYHEACDDFNNINEQAFLEMTYATYSVVQQLVDSENMMTSTVHRNPVLFSVPQNKCNKKEVKAKKYLSVE